MRNRAITMDWHEDEMIRGKYHINIKLDWREVLRVLPEIDRMTMLLFHNCQGTSDMLLALENLSRHLERAEVEAKREEVEREEAEIEEAENKVRRIEVDREEVESSARHLERGFLEGLGF